MKKMQTAIMWAAVAALGIGPVAFVVSGCQSAPTRLETKLFDIETNLVARVTTVTNVVPERVTNTVVVWQTNMVNGVPEAVPVSNATVEVRYATNLAVATNFAEAYHFTPNTNTARIGSIVGRTVGVFGPLGELVTVLLGGVFGVWGYLRSTRAAKLAGVLLQVIETGRQVLQATPEGKLLDDEWKLWMVKHQAEQGVITDVVELLGRVVDTPSAREVAEKLVEMMKERQGKG